jgi:hypothetical protein
MLSALDRLHTNDWCFSVNSSSVLDSDRYWQLLNEHLHLDLNPSTHILIGQPNNTRFPIAQPL